MDSISDEIESILYIAREVSGMCTPPLCAMATNDHPPSIQDSPSQSKRGSSRGRMGRSRCAAREHCPHPPQPSSPLTTTHSPSQWKGRMRIIEKGESAALLLEDSQTGAL